MKNLTISKETRIGLYEKVRELTSHSDLYYKYHVEPVAKNCFKYADSDKIPVGLDQTICELGGLLHDIGYTENYESNEGDHIKRGVEISEEVLKKFEIIGNFAERIKDCIWTHDGNLHRSKFLKYGSPPLENIIVNDVDALTFFEWPIDKLIEFVKDRLRIPNYEEIILKEAEKTFGYIHNPFFQQLAKNKYRIFKEKLENYD